MKRLSSRVSAAFHRLWSIAVTLATRDLADPVEKSDSSRTNVSWLRSHKVAIFLFALFIGTTVYEFRTELIWLQRADLGISKSLGTFSFFSITDDLQDGLNNCSQQDDSVTCPQRGAPTPEQVQGICNMLSGIPLSIDDPNFQRAYDFCYHLTPGSNKTNPFVNDPVLVDIIRERFLCETHRPDPCANVPGRFAAFFLSLQDHAIVRGFTWVLGGGFSSQAVLDTIPKLPHAITYAIAKRSHDGPAQLMALIVFLAVCVLLIVLVTIAARDHGGFLVVILIFFAAPLIASIAFSILQFVFWIASLGAYLVVELLLVLVSVWVGVPLILLREAREFIRLVRGLK